MQPDSGALLVVVRHSGWRSALLRGGTALALGLCALAWPETSLAVLLALLAGYAAVSGGAALVLAYRLARAGVRARFLACYAAVALAAAAALVLWAAPTTSVMVTLFAAWMVVTGASELALAARLWRLVPHVWPLVWPLVFTAAASLAFAWALLAEPPWAARVAVRLVGLYAVLSGAFLVGMALRLRRWHTEAVVLTA
jgi:uncharacterized membrane protein HdeD (DUF308 family)